MGTSTPRDLIRRLGRIPNDVSALEVLTVGNRARNQVTPNKSALPPGLRLRSISSSSSAANFFSPSDASAPVPAEVVARGRARIRDLQDRRARRDWCRR